jgi:hypothetical protein
VRAFAGPMFINPPENRRGIRRPELFGNVTSILRGDDVAE